MSNGLITVTPIYGHGWFEGGKASNHVPEPFEMIVHVCSGQMWQGRVAMVGHQFNGREVELSQRHVDWTGAVNVVVRPVEGKTGLAEATGFATLDRRPA